MPSWMALTGMLPALALMTVVDAADAKRPEPHWQVRKLALLGGFAVVPVFFLQTLLAQLVTLTGLASAFFDGFVSAALIEEGAKALVLWLGVWRHPAFDERLDGIVYATRAGLGFASVESVLALSSTDSTVGFLSAFVARALVSVPAHAIAAGFIGDFAARRRFDGTGPGLPGGLFVAVLLHGLYDTSLFLTQVSTLSFQHRSGLAVVPLFIVGVGFIALRARASEALRRDDADHRHAGRRVQHAGAGFVLR
jgi:protease PrsW